MQFHNVKEKVLIIDFGSQVTKLIARRVRDLGIFSEIITPKEIKRVKDWKANVVKIDGFRVWDYDFWTARAFIFYVCAFQPERCFLRNFNINIVTEIL